MPILLTGGGTAGHVLPNLAIADAISRDTKVFYIGSRDGLEGDLVKRAGIPFEYISVGKFRRYFDLRNFFDLFRIPFGIAQAWWKLGRIKPQLVFSKGGFVSFPVVVAAKLRGIPVLTHESDAILGLATRLIAPFADKVLLGFDINCPRGHFVGNPIRKELLAGNARTALKTCGFDGKRKVLLVMGGSTGSQQLNEIIAAEKSELIKHFDVVHVTGEGKGKVTRSKHYYSVPYIHEMADFLALASLALSRSGANALAELQTLQIPTLLYPLGAGSRGDQLANAQSAVAHSKLFKIADESKPALAQLLKLPQHPSKQLPNHALEKIVKIIKTYL